MENTPDASPLDALRREVRGLLDRGDHDGASEACTRGLQEAPGDIDLLFFRGLAGLRAGKFETAIQDYDALLAARPDHANARFNRAFCLLKKGDHEAACAGFDAFLALQPQDADGFFQRGRCHLGARRPRQAVADLSRALELRPDHPDARFERGRALQALGEWKAAGEEYGASLQGPSPAPNAYYNRAYCKGKMGDHAGAIEDFSRFLEQVPGDVDGHLQRGNRRMDAGDYARARSDYEKAVSPDAGQETELRSWIELARRLEDLSRGGPAVEYAAACCERGWAKSGGNDDVTAALWFNRALDAAGDHADALHGRGLSRARLKQYAEAIEDLRRAAGLRPESPELWKTLGWARRQAGQPAEAVADYDRALQCKGDDLDALFGRALARGAAADWAGAEGDYTRLIEADPKNAAAWLNRGWARRRLGRPREAIEDLGRSLEIDGRDALAWSNRGHARKEAGDVAGAVADFEKALSLDPSMESEIGSLIRDLRSLPKAAASPAPLARAPAGAAELPGFRTYALTWLVGAALIVGLGLLRIPVLSDPFTRTVDLPWKVGWIVSHGSDRAAFPPSSDVCMEPFCPRTDTEEKYVTGRRGYTSEVRYHYCPDHSPRFLSINHKFGGFLLLIYWALVALASFLLIVPPLILLFRILMWPWLLILVLFKGRPARILLPGGPQEDRDGLDAILFKSGFAFGFSVLLAAWILFIWF